MRVESGVWKVVGVKRHCGFWWAMKGKLLFLYLADDKVQTLKKKTLAHNLLLCLKLGLTILLSFFVSLIPIHPCHIFSIHHYNLLPHSLFLGYFDCVLYYFDSAISKIFYFWPIPYPLFLGKFIAYSYFDCVIYYFGSAIFKLFCFFVIYYSIFYRKIYCIFIGCVW